MKEWYSVLALLAMLLRPVSSAADECVWNAVELVAGPGHADGEFDHPQGIASLIPYVYIADTGNNRIQRWSSTGGPLLSFDRAWGGAGSGDGAFNAPTDVAVHNFDRLFVVDSGNNRVQVFTPDGAFLSSWGGTGSSPGQFLNPHSVAVDNENATVYVTDRGNYRVQKFSLDGRHLKSWGTQGSGDGEFQEPVGIAVLGSEVFVADRALGKVQVFTLDGVFVRTFGSPGGGDGQLSSPVGVSIMLGYSLILVSDSGNNRAAVFASDGTWSCAQSGYAMSDIDSPGGWISYGVSEASSELVRFVIFDPVKPTTWGGIKSLYAE